MTSKTFNGHRNWNHWNVSLWLFNDEPLYIAMKVAVAHTDTLDDAARELLGLMRQDQHTPTPETPDGAPYTFTSVRAALKHWDA